MHTDARDVPAYRITEAARYVRVPRGTLRWWVQAPTPLIVPPEAGPLLSFNNLVEAHVIRALRRVHGVRMGNVRSALSHAQDKLNIPRLLLDEDLLTDGVDLFLEHLGQLIDLSRSGQLTMRKLLEAQLERIGRDGLGLPRCLYPTLSHGFNDPRGIMIDAAISFGRPILARSGVSTRAITDRYDAGEQVADLARDYDIRESQVNDAVLYEAAA